MTSWWRCSKIGEAFEQPPLLDGAPDYTAETTARRHQELETYTELRLEAIETADWPVEQQVDWHSGARRDERHGFQYPGAASRG